ncbi:MAG: hypothetical protein M1813_007948 [Trichoglossum hirsutum]|nr:MAG: hypothetical protein M1813_007948 [Trichoglossum hirsutum]
MLDNVCLPVNLDAFVLNKDVCESGLYRIAPITQPDYVSLRLDNAVIQHDVLPHVDLHASQPAIANPRISTAYSAPLKPLDLKSPKPNPQQTVAVKESRLGVYLHWSLPRGYRAGSSAAEPPKGSKGAGGARPNPVFRLVPNRWLVVRVLKKTFLPEDANVPLVDAWVIESDRLRKVEELGGDVDLETDVSPYVSYDSTADRGNLLHSQAEKYIGLKTPLKDWSEDPNASRVPLTIFNSSNPLFADYTIHNPNVFSMKDNFQYAPGKYLDSADCDYIVIGWHSKVVDCPLGDNGIFGNLEGRLQTFLCSLKDTTDQKIKDSKEQTALISHGAIYGVSFDRSKKPTNIPAQKYAENFTTGVDMEPVAVGTTPLDSLLTFLQAHRKDVKDEERILGPGTSSIAERVLCLSELLYATEDDYDSRIKASDLIYSHNFNGSPGGFTWHYDKKKEANEAPVRPSEVKDKETGMSELDWLNRLNELQQHLDITERMLSINRWSLFAEFFKYFSDAHNDNNKNDRLSKYKNRVKALFDNDTPPTRSGIISTLESIKADVEKEIGKITDERKPIVQARKIANNPFFTRTDPTITIAGIDSGWPVEYLSRIPIRFDSDVVAPSNDSMTKLLEKVKKLPDTSGNILTTIAKLLSEASDGEKTGLGFKKWDGQPFCPVFIEWEAVYYNVDFSQWEVSLTSSPVTPNNQPQVRYVNPAPLTGLPGPTADTRVVSGRILVLPQPSFALSAVVKQVFSTAGATLPPGLRDQDTQNQLLDDLAKLKFISGDLAGLTDCLLTLGTGSHVKPNMREQGKGVVPLKEAFDLGGKIGLTEEHLVKIDGESGKTPFGTLVDFTSARFQPFKGVQHGQLAITKLNIIDKFGQAVSCPTPRPTPRIKPTMPEFVHPCLADQLCPGVFPPDSSTLNTVFVNPDGPTSSGARLSPFVQLTPAINQDARINASWLRRGHAPSSAVWSPCSDWENPVFGWIIINYADSALQFFTGSGIFYTSLQFGGPTGTMTSPKWAPFATPPPSSDLVSQQLVDLIAEMQGDSDTARAYLAAMWDMINSAIVTMPFPPSQYSAYANAIVGKPLALVNAGWSLELAQPVRLAQHTLGKRPGELGPTEQDAMDGYKFPVKIGASERPFDGVVCYWDTDNASTGTTAFAKIHTYFPGDGDPRADITPPTFPKLQPYFLKAMDFKADLPGLSDAQAAKLMVKTLLIDPYTPVHLYTGILPIKSLQLPGWTLSDAMKNMTAFFTLGPILTTKDVPKHYDSSPAAVLRPDSWLHASDNPTASPDAYPIKLPIAGGKGMWNWLQPYVDANPPNPADGPRPLYNALQVGQEDGNLRADPAPYTLLEGFLQLARPLVRDDVGLS